MKKEYIIPIFVPHLGCTKCCTFCNQKKISGELKQVTPNDVVETIKYYLSNFKNNDNYIEVAFFGGSFTAIDKKTQEELLSAVQPFIQEGKVNSIRLSTRPDAIDKDILKMLKKYNVKTIELGVQSTNNYILEKCKRGHDFEDVRRSSKLIKRKGFNLGHQMMIGLPDSTEKDDIQTAKDITRLKPKMVRIYPVLVIKGTELEQEFNKGEYTPLNVAQAVERSKEAVKLFRKHNIEVIRTGLQNTETITNPEKKESEVIAGPYHPAFGQLVEDAIWYDKIVEEIKKINAKIIKVEILANRENINNIIGHKKENINKLKSTYAVIANVKENNKIKTGKFKINILETTL